MAQVTRRKIHFLYAGGAAVGAVAALTVKAGYAVSTCEKLDPNSPYFQQLKKLGIKTFEQEAKEHLEGVDLLVVSQAVFKKEPNNIELLEAKERGIKVQVAEEFLAEEILGDKYVLAVAGTNGKSTTTAMLAKILIDAGLDPTCLVGAMVAGWGSNYRVGKSKYFVLEADEYADKFLFYSPKIELITNIEFDHPDYFQDLGQIKSSFEKFASRLAPEGKIFLGGSVSLETNKPRQVAFQGRSFSLKIPGKFNQDNASLAFAASLELGVSSGVAQGSLEHFSGISRRFEFKGEAKGVKVFDDYAHHPSAVAVTLAAAREKFPKEKIWCVFQPHTYSRLEKLFDDFASAFQNAKVDELIFLPVFGSRETEGKIDSVDLAKKVGRGSKYLDQDEAVTHLVRLASVGDVVLFLGAGDVYKLSSQFLRKMDNRG